MSSTVVVPAVTKSAISVPFVSWENTPQVSAAEKSAATISFTCAEACLSP